MTRPARSSAAPSALPKGEAATPAAHITVRASMRVVLLCSIVATPFSSTPVTRAPVRTSTPSFSSCTCAFADSSGGNAGSTRSPPSSNNTRAARESKRRNSPASVWRAISASVPASSTPVAPAPITAKVSHARRGSSPVSRSACSNASSTRRRIAKASSSVFNPGACAAQASLPK